MKGRNVIIISLIVLAALIAGYAYYGADNGAQQVKIIVDRHSYSPAMSSTVGIGLVPGYPASLDNKTVAFRWQTDFGHFISWDAPDFKVNDRGQDITVGDGKIYWSYSPDDMDKEKPVVHVTLSIIDKASGKALDSTGIDIGWENKQVAKVLN